MKTKTAYICEKCSKSFETITECRECEASHVMPSKMVSVSYIYPDSYVSSLDPFKMIGSKYDTIYPYMIVVDMKDGKQLKYKIDESSLKDLKKETKTEKTSDTPLAELADIFSSLLR